MNDNGYSPHTPRAAGDVTAAGQTTGGAVGKRRSPWPLAVVATLFIVVPFLSWYGTSFWRTLSDAEIEEYLSDQRKLRHVQHALEEIDRRIVKGDAAARAGARRWYPQVVRFASDSSPELRLSAAWVMGDDNTSEEFRAALAAQLEDSDPAVRRMAALSLSRFNDPRARDELLAIFRPYGVASPAGGTLLTVLSEKSSVRRGALVARLRDAGGQVVEVRSPLSGRVSKLSKVEGSPVNAGDELMSLSPDGENVLQALRALYLVGSAEDLPVIEVYARGAEGMPGLVKEQAALTSEEIRRRSGAKSEE
jgi:HEAT repeat protein